VLVASVLPFPPLGPLFHTYHPGITDNFYTLNFQQAFSSMQNGYVSKGILAYVERTPQPTASPFLRYWKGPPQREHVYLTDNYPDELSYVLNNGYVAEGNEGYLHTQQVPGCGQGATSVMIEAFSPTFSTVTGRCTPNVLRNNVIYSVHITVSDTAE
jgi:hypothetical protein